MDYKRKSIDELIKWVKSQTFQDQVIMYQGKPVIEALEKLAEYEDKIENGTLVELPCKVGDAVYRVVNDKRRKYPDECKVVGIFIGTLPIYSEIYLVKYTNGTFVYSVAVPLSEVGKTIFLTKAEAEAKLRELEGGRE